MSPHVTQNKLYLLTLQPPVALLQTLAHNTVTLL
jgi:hypothetical protein